ncbi:MAG: DUF6178 family protein [Nannocystaceae bacterium]
MTRTPPDHRLHADDLHKLVEDPLSLELRDDLPLVVPLLPPQAFVAATRKLRHEQRLELLLPHATAEQLTSVADLDVWENDRVLIPKAREWLLEIARCYHQAEKQPGELVELIYAMDPEMWTFALMHATAVVELDPTDNMALQIALDNMSALATYETPDGRFVLGVPDNELGRMAFAVVDTVYRDDLEMGRKLVNSVKWSLPAELEEQLLQWRLGRLADLGFPVWEEAMGLFRPLAVEAALRTSSPTPRDADNDNIAKNSENTANHRRDRASSDLAAIPAGGENDLLLRAMTALDPKEHGERSREFLLVANELLAAQRLEPGDEKHQERAIIQANATICLGMERLVGVAHPENIDSFLAGRITAVGLRSLFRVGYGALALLRNTALSLHRNGSVSLSEVGSLLDRPLGISLRALSAWLPELALVSRTGTRPIRTLADIAKATSLLATSASLSRLCFDADGYNVDSTWISRVDEPDRLRLGDLIRTAIIHQRLPGSTSSIAPLTPDDVEWAKTHLLLGDHLDPSLREAFLERCGRVGAGVDGDMLAESILSRLLVELTNVEYAENGNANLERIGGLLTVQSVSVWLHIRTNATGNTDTTDTTDDTTDTKNAPN